MLVVTNYKDLCRTYMLDLNIYTIYIIHVQVYLYVISINDIVYIHSLVGLNLTKHLTLNSILKAKKHNFTY